MIILSYPITCHFRFDNLPISKLCPTFRILHVRFVHYAVLIPT